MLANLEGRGLDFSIRDVGADLPGDEMRGAGVVEEVRGKFRAFDASVSTEDEGLIKVEGRGI